MMFRFEGTAKSGFSDKGRMWARLNFQEFTITCATTRGELLASRLPPLLNCLQP